MTGARCGASGSPTRGQVPAFPRSATSAMGSQQARLGQARGASRGGAPQGTRNFDERSDGKVYGATPSCTAKENVTHPKEHRGDGLLRGTRSPSGEPPEALADAASETEHPPEGVEGNES